MNKVVINAAENGYNVGLELSWEAIVRGYEIGLFTKEKIEKNPNIYYNIPRHHPLLVQLIEDKTIEYTDDVWEFDPVIVEIDSDTYSIVKNEEDGSEKVITPDDKSFNWTKI